MHPAISLKVSYRDRYFKRYDRNQDPVCSGNSASTTGKICSIVRCSTGCDDAPFCVHYISHARVM